jgi:hypothetical protein
MTDHQTPDRCIECPPPAGERFFCVVRSQFHRLNVPPREQIVLINIASKKKIDCESLKNILSKIIKLKN